MLAMIQVSCPERQVKPDSRYLSACKGCECEGYVAPNEHGETDCLDCGHPEAWHGRGCDKCDGRGCDACNWQGDAPL